MNTNIIKTSVNKLLYEPFGQGILCAIFGLALSLMFHRVCKGDCTDYFAPNLNEIKNKIFKLENECYTYTPYVVKCGNEENVLKPYDINTRPDNYIKEATFFSNIMNN